MSHHEVLDAVHLNSSVILAEHSNTERGFLRVLRDQMKTTILNNQVEILLSQADQDPLRIF